MHSPHSQSSTESESHGCMSPDGQDGTTANVYTDSILTCSDTQKSEDSDSDAPEPSTSKVTKTPSVVIHEITYGPKRVGPLIRRPMAQRLRSSSQPDTGAVSSLLNEYSFRGRATGFSSVLLANIRCHECGRRPYDARRLAEASCRIQRYWPALEKQYLEDFGPVGKIIWNRCMCGTCGHWAHQNCTMANSTSAFTHFDGRHAAPPLQTDTEETSCMNKCTIL